MRTVSEKNANNTTYCMDDTDFFSTETITLPIGFRLFRDCSIASIVNNRKNIRLSGTGVYLLYQYIMIADRNKCLPR